MEKPFVDGDEALFVPIRFQVRSEEAPRSKKGRLLRLRFLLWLSRAELKRNSFRRVPSLPALAGVFFQRKSQK
jgi:hypothetical protein